MARYAQNTSVSSENSRAEIERTLRKYGASGFGYAWDDASTPPYASIMFMFAGRQIRFFLTMPPKDKFRRTEKRRQLRSLEEAEKAWEQACRQAWRALALVIKAKLEAVEAGITCFEDEFLAHIVLPDNRTVSQFLRPQLAAVYETGKMPKQLPMLDGV